MKYQDTFQRYELKFKLTKKQTEMFLLELSKYMEKDEFYKTSIYNIYFDTDNDYFIRNSLEKPIYKEKLRVRSYKSCNKSDQVYLELKKKFDSIVYKRRCNILYDNLEQFLINPDKFAYKNQILTEIAYFTKLFKGIKPAMFLYYDRYSFKGIEDSNLRVTIDENITARDYDLTLNKRNLGEKILEDDYCLLEIKTDKGLPIWCSQFLSNNQIYKTSFSKYGNAYTQIKLNKLNKKEKKYAS